MLEKIKEVDKLKLFFWLNIATAVILTIIRIMNTYVNNDIELIALDIPLFFTILISVKCINKSTLLPFTAGYVVDTIMNLLCIALLFYNTTLILLCSLLILADLVILVLFFRNEFKNNDS